MNVIFVGRKTGRVKQFDLRHPLVIGAAALLVLGIVGGGVLDRHGPGRRGSAPEPDRPVRRLVGGLAAATGTDRGCSPHILQEKVNALALARRADERQRHPPGCARQATDPHGESRRRRVRFRQSAGLGGWRAGATVSRPQIPNLTAMVDGLQTQLSSREQQLGVLENLILTRELNKQVYPEGRPVKTASSRRTSAAAPTRSPAIRGPQGPRLRGTRGHACHRRWPPAS